MNRFEQELLHLKHRTLQMGAMAESMVAASSNNILHPERTVMRQVLTTEPDLDGMQIEIDREAIRLITIYSPAARDLRFLLMLVRINSELERIGDQAVNNCEYAELLLNQPPPEPLEELSLMSATSLEMTRGALQAFEAEDVRQARAVMERDDEIDAMNARLVRDVLCHKASDSEIAARSIALLIGRSLERIADHATNICEEVFYMVKGEDIRHPT